MDGQEHASIIDSNTDSATLEMEGLAGIELPKKLDFHTWLDWQPPPKADTDHYK